MTDPNASQLQRLKTLQRKIATLTKALPELTIERDVLLFDLLQSGVSERHIARETGISRGGIYQAKLRRARRAD